MDEQTMEQITECTQRLVAAAGALQKATVDISAQQQQISAKVDRIVAEIEGKDEGRRTRGEVKSVETVQAGRKTLSPMVTAILAKSGVDDGAEVAVLDKALSTLTPEQRIAVKTEMARAGMIQ
jgi:hypothetical protein